jgi:pimeloyl-ACP methyl ester carboxylesterase
MINGREDQVLPLAHGVALSKEIKEAKLLPLEGVGHDLPRGVWNVVLPALLEHTAASTPSK